MNRFWLAILMLMTSEVNAQSQKRLGVIDIESQTLTPDERKAFLNYLRIQIASKKVVSVLSSEETEEKLVEKPSAELAVEKIFSDQQSLKVEMDAKIGEGKDHYLASHFEEAIQTLTAAFDSLKEVSLVLVTSEIPEEVLKLISASHFFLGDAAKAKDYLNALLDLNPSAELDANQFPPDFIKMADGLRQENRYVWELWSAKSSQKEISARFLGAKIPVIDRNDGIQIRLPLHHPILGSHPLVLMKKEFIPMSFSLNSLPEQVELTTTAPQRRSTQGLFKPLLAGETSPELKWFTDQLQIAVTFLGRASKDEQGVWWLQGQWLESVTGRISPVEISSSKKLPQATSRLVEQLISYLSADGRVMTDRSTAPLNTGDSNAEVEAYVTAQPFYKTWWFLTLAGAGLVGAGVGTYFLLRPSDSVQFQMRGP